MKTKPILQGTATHISTNPIFEHIEVIIILHRKNLLPKLLPRLISIKESVLKC